MKSNNVLMELTDEQATTLTANGFGGFIVTKKYLHVSGIGGTSELVTDAPSIQKDMLAEKPRKKYSRKHKVGPPTMLAGHMLTLGPRAHRFRALRCPKTPSMASRAIDALNASVNNTVHYDALVAILMKTGANRNRASTCLSALSRRGFIRPIANEVK